MLPNEPLRPNIQVIRVFEIFATIILFVCICASGFGIGHGAMFFGMMFFIYPLVLYTLPVIISLWYPVLLPGEIYEACLRLKAWGFLILSWPDLLLLFVATYTLVEGNFHLGPARVVIFLPWPILIFSLLRLALRLLRFKQIMRTSLS